MFLDADTIVCRSLVKYVCGMGSADVAFVPRAASSMARRRPVAAVL